MLITPLFWVRPISTFYPMMKSWCDLPHLFTLDFLVPPNPPRLMTILTYIVPFGQFKRSKLLYELIWKLSIPYSGALVRSTMMSFVEWLPPRTNILKTLGPAQRLGETSTFFFSSTLSSSFSESYAYIKENAFSKHGGGVLVFHGCIYVWCGCVIICVFRFILHF